MKIGDKAPDTLGHDENGQEVKLSDFAGKKLVLYFYPKDMTSGCTKQACNLRDHYQELKQKGYEVVGVSINDGKSHQRFIAKHELPFRLIADTESTLAQQFGVWAEKKMCGRTYMGMLRTTFVIDEQGKVQHVITHKQVDVNDHAAQILATE